jgi:hypothetical protein
VTLLAIFVFGLLIVGVIADTEKWIGDRVYCVELAYVALATPALALASCLNAVRRRR